MSGTPWPEVNTAKICSDLSFQSSEKVESRRPSFQHHSHLSYIESPHRPGKLFSPLLLRGKHPCFIEEYSLLVFPQLTVVKQSFYSSFLVMGDVLLSARSTKLHLQRRCTIWYENYLNERQAHFCRRH